MERIDGLLAVVTGGGHGMGRELARQLAAQGCSVAFCDVSETAMAETKELCLAGAPAGTLVSTFVADTRNVIETLWATEEAICTVMSVSRGMFAR